MKRWKWKRKWKIKRRKRKWRGEWKWEWKWEWEWEWKWEWRWWWHNKNINIFEWVWWRNNESKQKKLNNKKLSDHLDEIIDKSKSFEDQMKSIKKVKNLDDYHYVNDFGDKELKFKIFKLKLAHLSNEIDENLFEQIFGHTLEKLANK